MNRTLEPIVEAVKKSLVEGKSPWVKPWKSMGNIRPINGVHNTPYRGMNLWLLWATGELAGYETGQWATYKAWKSIGGNVRKGEKATTVVYYGTFEDEKEVDGVSTIKRVPVAKPYWVFNRDQVDGLEPAEINKPWHETDIEAELKSAGGRIKVGLKYGGDKAFYSPIRHAIGLPKPQQFDSANVFYQTFAHELGHATGHDNYLGRFDQDTFEPNGYAKEELVAELTAALTLQHFGIDDPRCQEQIVSYCAGWAGRIEADPMMYIRAVSAAQKAFDLLFPQEQVAKPKEELKEIKF
jgi:antirestriction protein ArdC